MQLPLLRKLAAVLLLVILTAFVVWQWQQLSQVMSRADRLESRYASLLNLMPAAFVVCNEDGIILTVSHEAERILGWRAEALVGNSIKQIMSEEASSQHETKRREAVDLLKKYQGSYVLDRVLTTDQVYSQDGKQLHLRIHMRGVYTSGQVEFISIIVPQRSSTTTRPRIEPLHVDPDDPPATVQEQDIGR